VNTRLCMTSQDSHTALGVLCSFDSKECSGQSLFGPRVLASQSYDVTGCGPRTRTNDNDQ